MLRILSLNLKEWKTESQKFKNKLEMGKTYNKVGFIFVRYLFDGIVWSRTLVYLFLLYVLVDKVQYFGLVKFSCIPLLFSNKNSMYLIFLKFSCQSFWNFINFKVLESKYLTRLETSKYFFFNWPGLFFLHKLSLV